MSRISKTGTALAALLMAGLFAGSELEAARANMTIAAGGKGSGGRPSLASHLLEADARSDEAVGIDTHAELVAQEAERFDLSHPIETRQLPVEPPADRLEDGGLDVADQRNRERGDANAFLAHRDEAFVVGKAVEHGGGSIRRAIIHHDQLETAPGLREDRLDCSRDETFRVVGGHADRNQRVQGSHGAQVVAGVASLPTRTW